MPKSSTKSTEPDRSAGRPPGSGKRRRLIILLALGILAVVVLMLRHFTSDAYLGELTVRIMEEATGAQVTVGQVTLSRFNTITLKNLSIYPPNAPKHPKYLLFEADEILIRHHPVQLLWGKLNVKELIFEKPELVFRYDRDRGASNIDFWFNQPPDEEFQWTLPAITVRDGILAYEEKYQGKTGPLLLQMIAGNVNPNPQKDHNYKFAFDTPEQGLVQKAIMGGNFSLDQPLLKFICRLNLQQSDLENIPTSWDTFRRDYQTLAPRGAVTLEGGFVEDEGWHLAIDLTDGRMRLPDPNLNVGLVDVDTHVDCTARGISVDLKGSLEEHGNFYAYGKIFGYSLAAPFDLTMGTQNLFIPIEQWDPNVPTWDQNKSAFIDSLLERLQNEPLNNFFRTLEPTGRLDLETRVQRGKSAEAPVRFSGQVVCRDANLKYERFPYPLTHISGRAIFDPNNVRVGPLISRRGEMEVTYQDHWYKENGRLCYTIDLHARDGALDETLYRALEPSQRKIWNRFSPTGKGNCHYTRSKDSQGNIKTNIDVEMTDVKATFDGFPLPLDHIRGTLNIQPGQCAFDIQHAEGTDGSLSLNGTLESRDAQITGFSASVNFENLFLDDGFTQYLPEKTKEPYRRAHLGGRADGSIKLWTTPTGTPKEKPRVDFLLQGNLHEARIKHERFPYELQNVNAEIRLTRNNLNILQGHGRHGDSLIHLSGQIYQSDQFHLDIKSDSLELTDELREAMEQDRPGFWTRFNPSGRVRVDLGIDSDPDKNRELRGTIEPLSAAIRPETFPYPFSNITGQVVLDPKKITLQDILSQDGDQQIRLDGDIQLAEPQLHNVHIRFQDVRLDRSLHDAVSPGLQSFWETLTPDGRLSGDLQLVHRLPPDDLPFWDIQGWTGINDGKVVSPLPTTDINGRLMGTARYRPETRQLDIATDCTAERFDVKGKQVENFSAKVQYLGQEKQLQVQEAQGDFFGGRISGQAQVRLENSPPGFDLELVFHEVDLAKMAQVDRRLIKLSRKMQGIMSGWYNLARRSSDQPRRGRFQFDVHDAVLGELPLVALLLNIAHLSIPKEGAFNEVSIQGHVAENMTLFDSIYMRGSALSVTGLGHMKDPNDTLDLVFVVGSPRDLPPIPGVDLIKIISPAFVHLQVGGTLSDPKVETVPLPVFEKALRYFSGSVLDFLNGNPAKKDKESPETKPTKSPDSQVNR